jgi:hypothetical protein
LQPGLYIPLPLPTDNAHSVVASHNLGATPGLEVGLPAASTRTMAADVFDGGRFPGGGRRESVTEVKATAQQRHDLWVVAV